MQNLFQELHTQVTIVKENISSYVSSLILTRGDKNCAAMAQELGIKSKVFYDFFKEHKENIEQIQTIIRDLPNKIFKKTQLKAFIIDSSRICKMYAEAIENLSYEYDGASGLILKGLTIVVAAISCGGITIPIDFEFYISKKLCPTGFRKKGEIARSMIDRAIKSKIHFDYIAMDGGFMSIEMLKYFSTTKSPFIMRIARNRLVTINGKEEQLQEHEDFKLKKNSKSITKKGIYKGYECLFTAEKRKTKKGIYETIFYISNIKVPPKKLLKMNSVRWYIEKLFRTIKQKLGLSKCRMVNNSKQAAHIWAVFLGYTIISTSPIYKEEKSVDGSLNVLRSKTQSDIFEQFSELTNVLMH